LGQKDRIAFWRPSGRLKCRGVIRRVFWYEQVSVGRQTLAQMVFERMIAGLVAMQVEVRRLEKTREQGDGRGDGPEAAHHRHSTRKRLRPKAF
jgi:hypothetical protein